ncbi:hypothetical protein HYFRA_00012641 [Hymenoscyphus fraxineus]|uniref:Uncharacterized protein n=1 Tax=Hymenoscyphus fraxineus TaxID=746836 RepID=A0A9N9L5L9_9HELO|nr:hypothetical protein HYFRA_00012641 [Hymenoscyphus fraxineus]
MQFRNLLVLATLATGVYGAVNGAAYGRCVDQKGIGLPASTRKACDAIKTSRNNGCSDCITSAARCNSVGRNIVKNAWNQFCLDNGAAGGETDYIPG